VFSDTFTSIGETIGQAIGGGADSVEINGRRMLAAFGGFLADIGKMAIAYGSFMLAMSLVEKLGWSNPAAAAGVIAAGVALVAIGGAIKSKMESGPKVTAGASVSGAGSSSFSGSSAGSSSFSGGGGTYVFEIEGTKLVGVLSNTMKRNKSLGGSLNFAPVTS